MTTSLPRRQPPAMTDTLVKASEQYETGLRDRTNRPAKGTPAGHDERPRNVILVASSPKCEDPSRIASVWQSNGLSRQHVQHGDIDVNDTDDTDDSKKMPRQLERQTKGPFYKIAADDPYDRHEMKRADMSRLSPPTNQAVADNTKDVGCGPKEMLREFNPCSNAARPGTVMNETGNLNDLEARIMNIKDAASRWRSEPLVAETAGPEIIPYTVALMLESRGYKWEQVQGWTLNLFNSGMAEYRAERQREHTSHGPKEKHRPTAADDLDEKKKRRAFEKSHLGRRLVLSNLAADVDEESIYNFFSKYQHHIRSIALLAERHPARGTRTAHVDMYSRRTAVHASFEFGYIFGLAVKIQLAVQ